MIDLSFFTEEKDSLIQKAAEMIRKCMRRNSGTNSLGYFLMPVIGYLLLRVRRENCWDCSYEDLVVNNRFSLDPELLDLLKESFADNVPALSEEAWEELLSLFRDQPQYDEEVFEGVCLCPSSHFRQYENRQDSFGMLEVEPYKEVGLKLLHIKKGDRVLDCNCHDGSFLVRAFSLEPNAHYSGISSGSNCHIACLRAKVLEAPLNIMCTDDLSASEGFPSDKTYDKIFNQTNGMGSYRYRSARYRRQADLYPDLPADVSSASLDWLHVYQTAGQLSEGGMAVVAVSESAAVNHSDRYARKYFAKQGILESVLFLPEKISGPALSPLCLLILHKKTKQEKNVTIRLADVSSLFKEKRRYLTLGPEELKRIDDAAFHDIAGTSHSYTLEELEEQDYSFWPARYTPEEQVIPANEARKLEEVSVRITRGTHASAKELNMMYSSDPTSARLLTWSGITDASLSDDMTYLKTPLDRKFLKYCVHPGDLIVSKNSFPVRTAVVDAYFGNQQILCSGNLYIVQLDTEQIDPYYLQSYLESEFGQKAIRKVMGGSAMKNISIDNLKNLIIPVPPLAEQMKVARTFRYMLRSLSSLRAEIESCRDNIRHTVFVPKSLD